MKNSDEVKKVKKKRINLHKVYLLFVFLIFCGFIGTYAYRIYNDFFKKEPVEEIQEEKKPCKREKEKNIFFIIIHLKK